MYYPLRHKGYENRQWRRAQLSQAMEWMISFRMKKNKDKGPATSNTRPWPPSSADTPLQTAHNSATVAAAQGAVRGTCRSRARGSFRASTPVPIHMHAHADAEDINGHTQTYTSPARMRIHAYKNTHAHADQCAN